MKWTGNVKYSVLGRDEFGNKQIEEVGEFVEDGKTIWVCESDFTDEQADLFRTS
jgi:hypothetical protein